MCAVNGTDQRKELGRQFIFEVDHVLECLLLRLKQFAFPFGDPLGEVRTGGSNRVRIFVIGGALDERIHLIADSPQLIGRAVHCFHGLNG